jgi:hypothetical protein
LAGVALMGELSEKKTNPGEVPRSDLLAQMSELSG